MLNFFDLSPNKLTENIILKSKNKNPKSLIYDRFTTKRNSKYMAFEWRKNIKNVDISKVQHFCSESMKSLGYSPMIIISIYKYEEIYPFLVEPPKDMR